MQLFKLNDVCHNNLSTTQNKYKRKQNEIVQIQMLHLKKNKKLQLSIIKLASISVHCYSHNSKFLYLLQSNTQRTIIRSSSSDMSQTIIYPMVVSTIATLIETACGFHLNKLYSKIIGLVFMHLLIMIVRLMGIRVSVQYI